MIVVAYFSSKSIGDLVYRNVFAISILFLLQYFFTRLVQLYFKKSTKIKALIFSKGESKTEDLPIILLGHAPYALEYAIQNNVDIQFSGHTHNGQIFPFNYVIGTLFDHTWG